MFQVFWGGKKCMIFHLPSMHVPCPTYLISLNSFTLITPYKITDHTAPVMKYSPISNYFLLPRTEHFLQYTVHNFYLHHLLRADRGSTVVKALCYKSEGRCFDPSWCQWIFQRHKNFRSHCGPGVDSSTNINEYQEYFLEVKAAGE